MRYILRSAVTFAYKIVSVAIESVAGISQPALTSVLLENGKSVQFHAGHTGYAPPAVGDYVTSSMETGLYQHVPKRIFEELYIAEYDVEMYQARKERLEKLVGVDAPESVQDGNPGQ